MMDPIDGLQRQFPGLHVSVLATHRAEDNNEEASFFSTHSPDYALKMMQMLQDIAEEQTRAEAVQRGPVN